MLTNAFNGGVTVQTVADLYSRFAALDVPGYYKKGEENPYAQRIQIIPRKANFYAMVPASDESRVDVARKTMKGLAGRRKVREVVCEKDEVNYNQFERAGKIVVLYA